MKPMQTTEIKRRLPEWLRRPLPMRSALETHEVLSKFSLNTVCESARCPNRAECYSKQTATFMILGDVCTRRCGFCSIETGRPFKVDRDEPRRVAEAAKALGLAHVVVTSVARDDLQDEGADAFVRTIKAVRELLPDASVEVLTPDFHARIELISRICDAGPTVFNHNIETVRRLTHQVRPQARYERSLEVLKSVKRCAPAMTVKSGVMLGLGESIEEVITTLQDLRRMDVDVVTIGQYLKPSEGRLEIEKFIHPEVFSDLERVGNEMGFSEVYSGPYVRSSYHAGEVYSRSLSIV